MTNHPNLKEKKIRNGSDKPGDMGRAVPGDDDIVYINKHVEKNIVFIVDKKGGIHN